MPLESSCVTCTLWSWISTPKLEHCMSQVLTCKLQSNDTIDAPICEWYGCEQSSKFLVNSCSVSQNCIRNYHGGNPWPCPKKTWWSSIHNGILARTDTNGLLLQLLPKRETSVQQSQVAIRECTCCSMCHCQTCMPSHIFHEALAARDSVL